MSPRCALRSSFAALFFFAGCSSRVTEVADPATRCEGCHASRPILGGEVVGIEDAHPYGDIKLGCADCHGGNAEAYAKEEAHVAPPGSSPSLRNLSVGQLDAIDPAYIRFVNPSDLRVVNAGCGSSSPQAGETGCHQSIIDTVRLSAMAHNAGEVVIARYRAGAQDDPLARVGSVDLVDETYDPSILGASPSMTRFVAPPPDLDALSILSDLTAATSTAALELYAAIQDDYMEKGCYWCHLWDFGRDDARGNYRSSGCAACHFVYNDDGLSRSKDPVIPKDATAHPEKHEITTKIPLTQCAHCHFRGGRIGPSYLGYREAGKMGFDSPKEQLGFLGEEIHGKPGDFYITDEDTTNDVDETPPDIHFEKGLHCIDCHTVKDVHGDGHMYASTQVPVSPECEDCHGGVDTPANGKNSRGDPIKNLSKDEQGRYWLKLKISGEDREVPQVVDALNPASPRYSEKAERAMGRDPATGFSHTDRIECYTCHSAWYQSCYGCHITMDFSQEGKSTTTGEKSPGKESAGRYWVKVDDLVLMWNVENKIGPSMPAERFFMTVKDRNGNVVMENRVRSKVGRGGQPTFGQRTQPPHTTRKESPFQACERCHIERDGSNRARVEQAVGLGTDRYLFTDDLGRTYRMDAIIDEEGGSVVDVGHPYPEESRPLEPELRRKLLEVPVR